MNLAGKWVKLHHLAATLALECESSLGAHARVTIGVKCALCNYNDVNIQLIDSKGHRVA